MSAPWPGSNEEPSTTHACVTANSFLTEEEEQQQQQQQQRSKPWLKDRQQKKTERENTTSNCSGDEIAFELQ
jgi:hypothetical protein